MKVVIPILIIVLMSFTFIQQPKPIHKPIQPTKKVYIDTIISYRAKPKMTEKQPVNEIISHIKITSTIKSFKVSKRHQKMIVYFGDTFKVFRIALGGNPKGHKTERGDLKTPEGNYHISYKNPHSRGYKSLKISYPNKQDRQYAKSIGKDPGGDIFIHGLWWENQDPIEHWKTNWTLGCIALNNQEIEEIFNYTELNTPITILP
jgi:murein L,D-transpeptidase YafK